MKKSKRIHVLLICIIYIGIVLLSESYIIGHQDHDCEGHNCAVCAQIQIAEKLLKQFSAAAAGTITMGIYFSILLIKTVTNAKDSASLVQQKVRLNI